jgi:hypothetical protein
MTSIFGIALALYLRSNLSATLTLIIFSMMVWLAVCAVGVYSQIYRYLKNSDPVQRQQAKWVAAGLVAVLVGMLTNASLILFANNTDDLTRLFVNMLRAFLVNVWLAFLPISLAISILRYRLWDIDLIIRRTLQYSLLTGLLSLVYFSGVALLQAVLGVFGGQFSAVVIVLTTLAIYILFNPLRRRVQEFIDRRFYRQKYNAEQALAEFAAAARSETDLEKISQSLLDTVQTTLQPAAVSVWMKPTLKAVKVNEVTQNGGFAR